MSDALGPILAATRVECARLRRALPDDVGHAPLDVHACLGRTIGSGGPALALIAEIKHRSPSAGALSRALSPADRARAYVAGGAAMVSVLVDRAAFDGDYAHVSEARAAVSVPLLAKGFCVDPIQVEAARRAGADAVLLIARILDRVALAELHACCLAAGLTPIVEVVDEPELERALAVSPRVLGVNARDLSTLIMDRARADRVVAAIPPGPRALFFSGLSTPADVARVSALPRVDGALVGEVLMRSDAPTPVLAALAAAAGACAPRMR